MRKPRTPTPGRPWQKHQLAGGQFTIHGVPEKIFWKIDYYAPDLVHGSENPSDPQQTVRVLTLMLSSEY